MRKPLRRQRLSATKYCPRRVRSSPRLPVGGTAAGGGGPARGAVRRSPAGTPDAVCAKLAAYEETGVDPLSGGGTVTEARAQTAAPARPAPRAPPWPVRAGAVRDRARVRPGAAARVLSLVLIWVAVPPTWVSSPVAAQPAMWVTVGGDRPTGLWAKRDDMIVHTVEPYNAEPPRSALAGRTLTPVETFYSRNHGPIPDIAPEAWRLELPGLLDRPRTLSLAQLRGAFAHRKVVATVQCAGNRRTGLLAVRDLPGEIPWRAGAISTARWTGVSLADVLAEARPRPGAAHVAFTAPDVAAEAHPPQPYGASIPLAKAAAGDVLLAWAMNDEPLPPVHGGPVRLVVPGYIGARSVKWVTGIAVRERPSENYFQAVSYRLLPPGLQLGPVAVNADLLAPEGGAILPAGETSITARACDTAAAAQPERAEPHRNPRGYVNISWPRVRVIARRA